LALVFPGDHQHQDLLILHEDLEAQVCQLLPVLQEILLVLVFLVLPSFQVDQEGQIPHLYPAHQVSP
jgi:hypothetical protein